MEEEPLSEGAPEMAAGLRALGEADRDIMEKATRAFVSYVRGYKEHQARARNPLNCLPIEGFSRAHGRVLPPVGAACSATLFRLKCHELRLAFSGGTICMSSSLQYCFAQHAVQLSTAYALYGYSAFPENLWSWGT